MTINEAIKNAMQAAEISRYYVSGYESSAKSDKLDGRHFMDLDEQRAYFRGKAQEFRRTLHDNLFGARAKLAGEMRTTTDAGDRAALESALAGIDYELTRSHEAAKAAK